MLIKIPQRGHFSELQSMGNLIGFESSCLMCHLKLDAYVSSHLGQCKEVMLCHCCFSVIMDCLFDRLQWEWKQHSNSILCVTHWRPLSLMWLVVKPFAGVLFSILRLNTSRLDIVSRQLHIYNGTPERKEKNRNNIVSFLMQIAWVQLLLKLFISSQLPWHNRIFIFVWYWQNNDVKKERMKKGKTKGLLGRNMERL